MKKHIITETGLAAAIVLLLAGGGAQAVPVGNDDWNGSFDSTITTGIGLRAQNRSPDLIIQGNSGGPPGNAAVTSFLGDQGNLNYDKGDLFSAYVKGTHELVLNNRENQIAFMARANWIRDFAATHTTGDLSSTTPPTGVSGGLTDEARTDLEFKARLLDLWVSKTFDVGGEQLRVRAGNQVINWGESLFTAGGVNVANYYDYMRLAQPGTQLKEAILPLPAISVASGLGAGFNMEAYYQFGWRRNYMPPIGSYWSVSNSIGEGSGVYGVEDTKARSNGQAGVALKYKPASAPLELGLYAANYHDKTPSFSMASGAFQWIYPEDRKVFGASANFPVGDWAIGTELSYRPKDAISLNSINGCTSQGGNCWVDEKKYQWNLTGLYVMSHGNAPQILDLLGAQMATFMGEYVVIRYPGLKPFYGPDPVSAGGWGWGTQTDPTATPISAGTKTSSGTSLDFSWTYDGTVLPGWQVSPEIFFSWALSGRTPTLTATFMSGAKSANFMINFSQNPAKYQFGVNYGRFWGGETVFDQPYKDRGFVGAYASVNF